MINVTKLHGELERAGIPIEGVSSDGQIDFLPEATSEQRDQATSVVAAHDPVDYVAQEAEANRVAILEMVDEVLAEYQAALDNWETLSPAQQNTVLKRHTQVLVRLLRFMRKQFDPFT